MISRFREAICSMRHELDRFRGSLVTQCELRIKCIAEFLMRWLNEILAEFELSPYFIGKIITENGNIDWLLIISIGESWPTNLSNKPGIQIKTPNVSWHVSGDSSSSRHNCIWSVLLIGTICVSLNYSSCDTKSQLTIKKSSELYHPCWEPSSILVHRAGTETRTQELRLNQKS